METAPKQASLSQRVFARFLRGSDDLSHAMYADKKRAMFKDLHGHVIEIGPGTGVNLQYYPPGITWTGIEPNPVLHSDLKEKARDFRINAVLRTSLDEAGRDANGCADFVVSTLVLCSVDDLSAALGEIRDLLKPEGRFLFLEHVVDRRNPLRRFIQRAAPYTPWRFFSDGCRPGRDIAAAIAAAGFAHVECHHYHQSGPGLIAAVNRPHIHGYAVR